MDAIRAQLGISANKKAITFTMKDTMENVIKNATKELGWA